MTSGWARLPAGHHPEPYRGCRSSLGPGGGAESEGGCHPGTQPRPGPERFQNTGVDNCLSRLPNADKLIRIRFFANLEALEALNHDIAWQRNPSLSLEVKSGGLQQQTDLASLACAHCAADCSKWIAMAWVVQVPPTARFHVDISSPTTRIYRERSPWGCQKNTERLFFLPNFPERLTEPSLRPSHRDICWPTGNDVGAF